MQKLLGLMPLRSISVRIKCQTETRWTHRFLDQFAQWSNTTVDHLFNNADAADFKLFFSFDMDPGYFSDPSQFTDYLKGYINKNAYFKYQGMELDTSQQTDQTF